jgi:hypothetical protein
MGKVGGEGTAPRVRMVDRAVGRTVKFVLDDALRVWRAADSSGKA